jgi:hypothetical protein
MKITTSQINDASLTELGLEVTSLIEEQKYKELADRFGYALAYEENPSDVIKKETSSCLSQAGEEATIAPIKNPKILVKYFKPNSSNLIAVVECTLIIDNGIGEILVELIIAGNGVEKHVSLEQISYQV